MIALLHGYGINIISPFQKPLSKDCGFEAFRHMIVDKKAAPFAWSISWKQDLLEALNPLNYIQLYCREKQKSADPAILLAFDTFLKSHAPVMLVCHSLGCHFLLNYIKKYDPPSTLGAVIFIQADVKRSFRIENNHINQRLQTGNLQWFNLWCSWDNALIGSLLINGYLPAGMFGASTPWVQNRFFPLYRRLNLHTSSINDPDLVKWIEKIPSKRA